MAALTPIADGVWTMTHPLVMAGISLGRTTTVVKLRQEKLLIHSTAPFTPGEVAAIQSLGLPTLMVDATRLHDTFAKEGREAFPQAVYFVPDPTRFGTASARPMEDLQPELGEEMKVAKLEGMTAVDEYLFLHKPSGTLILCDLLFNIGPPSNLITRIMLKWVSNAYGRPAMSRLYRMQIKDRAAFRASISSVLENWEFDKVIVGHGQPILADGRAVLDKALREAGF